MVEISYLPPEAGKLPWSAEGLNLLKQVQLEIDKWRTEVDEGNTKCNKADCCFCSLTKPVPKKIIPEFIMSHFTLTDPANHNMAWQEWELEVLDRHLPITIMIDLLPRRSKSAIFDKRRLYRTKLGLPLLQRGGKIKVGHF